MQKQITIQGNVDDRRQTVADMADIEKAQVELVRLDLEKMRRYGVLIQVHVYGTSMFQRRISWAEIGVPVGDVRSEWLNKGAMKLLPQKYMKPLLSLQSQIRDLLKRFSIKYEGFAPWRFVTVKAYQKWKAAFELLQQKWYALVEDILAHYDECKDILEEKYRHIVQEAWTALTARYRERGATQMEIATKEFPLTAPEPFVKHFIATKLPELPDPDLVRKKLRVVYDNGLVASGADLEEERLRALELLAQKERQQSQLNAARWREEMANEQKRAAIDAMWQAEIEHAREQLARTLSPLDEAVRRLRAQIYGEVQEIAALMRKNGGLRAKMPQRITGLLEIYELFSIRDDQALRTQLESLGQSTRPLPPGDDRGKYDTASILAQLDAISQETHQAAEDARRRAEARPTRARRVRTKRIK